MVAPSWLAGVGGFLHAATVIARWLLRCSGLAAAYLLAARFGLALDPLGGFAAPVWPPTGLALAALLLGGRTLWPGIFLGASVANLWAGAPVAAALAIGLGNTLEAVAAVAILRTAGFDPALERVRDVALLTAAALVSVVISAGIGVTSLWIAGVVGGAQVGPALRAWWVGDLLGALVVAPLLLTLSSRRPLWFGSRLEPLAVATFAALSTWFVFGGAPSVQTAFHQPFLVFPALVWAAVRLGQGGAVIATFLVSAAAIASTALGRGPFAGGGLHQSLLALQVFMGVVSVGVLLLGAASAERRRVRAALEAAVAIRDEFLSVAGHELRTPLAALGLDLGSLQRKLQTSASAASPDSELPALNQRALRVLRHSQRLGQLIDRLLEASQIQQGQRRIERQPMDLRLAVGEVVERHHEQAERAGCTLTVVARGDLTGHWDVLAVEQIAGNLIANAIKYGAAKPIEVSLEQRDDSVVLTVRDQGIGVSPEDVERIFDRFARAGSSRHIRGLGLGLYIARQLVEAHAGTISVASQPGGGASFIVQLPRAGTRT